MLKTLKSDYLARNRFLYIIEAAVEYFIYILVTDAFLATLLTRNGVSDAATGVISQLAALSFLAQLSSVIYKKTKGIKRWITNMHVLNQLMFVSLYLIPLFGFPKWLSVVLFAVMLLGGNIISNIISPFKYSYMMSFVPGNSRGTFTATKEIVSLITGMIFTFVMGAVVDYYHAVGKDNNGFFVCGITILTLSITHLAVMLLIKDPNEDKTSENHGQKEYRINLLTSIKESFTDKIIVKLMLIDIIWNFGVGISIPFYGVYKINELGFSLKYVSILSIMYAISRVTFSKYFGRYADKHSWSRLLIHSFIIASAAFTINVFTVPSNGRWMFAIYYCIYAVSMAGINSGVINIIYDYVDKDKIHKALGIKYAAGGVSSFIASLIGGKILSEIQNNGNKLFGITVYAQQVLTFGALIITITLIIYLIKVINVMPKLKQ
ncbi:MAG: MFS transporter [Clostridiales bacterium]|nr:MFS transporter [Clostridiales bacterium]